MLAAGRVGVDPADAVLERRGHVAGHHEPAPREVEFAQPGLLAHLARCGRGRRANGARPRGSRPRSRSTEWSSTPCAPCRSRRRASPPPRSARAARSIARRARSPSCGPPSRASRRARSGDPPLPAGRRSRPPGSGLHSFVFGTFDRYISAVGRWKSGCSNDSKVSSHHADPAQPKALPAPMPDSPPILIHSRSPATRVRDRRLGGDRAARAGLEEGEPDRSGGLLSRRLVHRVADPHPERLLRVAGLRGSSSRSGPRVRGRPGIEPLWLSLRPRSPQSTCASC